MSENNPYAYSAAETGSNSEEEMFDHEARVRIAEALHTSHFPMMCFAILFLLTAMLVAGLVLLAFLTSGWRFRNTSLRDVVNFVVSVSMPVMLSVFLLCVAGWLWSCSVALDRARKRLTIASLAVAVQAQSVFWRKTGRLAVVLGVLAAAMVGVTMIAESM